MSHSRRALFVSHGGGPLPLLGDAGHTEMVACLTGIAQTIPRPSAIVVVSAHWESQVATVTASEQPSLIYDYSGFPRESYEITYPCPGSPALADAVVRELSAAGIAAQADASRGLDHGVFVPLKILYPQADIPCVQLSLMTGLSSRRHIELGRALQGIAAESLLLIGSGFTFHNMQAFFTPDSLEAQSANRRFEQWLVETCSSGEMREDERAQRLVDWQAAPYARYCHPREEHLLPLHVCYGFTESACSKVHQLSILNKSTSMFEWQR